MKMPVYARGCGTRLSTNSENEVKKQPGKKRY